MPEPPKTAEQPRQLSGVPARIRPAGWHLLGPDDDFDDIPDEAFAPPAEELLDTSNCPVAATCAGCSSTTRLHAVTAAFSAPHGHDIGCVTLCPTCDGRSFLHHLDEASLTQALPGTPSTAPSSGNARPDGPGRVPADRSGGPTGNDGCHQRT